MEYSKGIISPDVQMLVVEYQDNNDACIHRTNRDIGLLVSV